MLARATIGMALALAAVPALAADSWPILLKVDGAKWKLRLELPGFSAMDHQQEGKRQIHTYLDRDRSMLLSVMIEQVPGKATMEGCREINRRRAAGGGTFRPVDTLAGTRDEAETMELSIPLSADGKVVQRHIFTCRVRGDRYIDSHVSKVRYTPEDRNALYAVLDGVAIVDPA